MEIINFYNIPIFIISYNRIDDLKKMVGILLRDGYTNLNIIDNNSSEKRLLSYLNSLDDSRIKVTFLQKNYGHRVLWESHKFDDIIQNNYYVLTDPDIFPVEGCPSNYVEAFYNILQVYPQKMKVGFSLKIDDLPDDYPYKYDIVRYESFYWEKKLPYKFTIYEAPIDTTFALYKPGKIKGLQFFDGIRTGDKYVARHQGWYTLYKDDDKSYLSENNISSTSMNANAMSKYQLVVIHRIIEKTHPEFYSLMQHIIINKELKNHYSFFQIFLAFGYVLTKKILLMLHLKE